MRDFWAGESSSLILRWVARGLRSLVFFVAMALVLFVALWGVGTAMDFDIIGETKRGWSALTDGSWKKTAGSVIGAWIGLWFVWEVLFGNDSRTVQRNNYRNGRGFIDLDGNGRDDRWQR